MAIGQNPDPIWTISDLYLPIVGYYVCTKFRADHFSRSGGIRSGGSVQALDVLMANATARTMYNARTMWRDNVLWVAFSHFKKICNHFHCDKVFRYINQNNYLESLGGGGFGTSEPQPPLGNMTNILSSLLINWFKLNLMSYSSHFVVNVRPWFQRIIALSTGMYEI
jgi:hypothetical protein